VNTDELLCNALTRIATEPSDEKAWKQLYSLTWPFAYAVLRKSRGMPDALSRDLAQDSLGRFAEYVLSPRHGSAAKQKRLELVAGFGKDAQKFRRWLKRLIVNKSIDWYRKHGREDTTDLEVERASSLDLDRSILAHEYEQLLPAFFRTLNRKDHRGEFDLLCAMAKEHGCTKDVAIYLWLAAFLHRGPPEDALIPGDGRNPPLDRAALIRDFGHRLKLTPTYTYVRLSRLREQFKQAGADTFV
jgi:hypothetical protein